METNLFSVIVDPSHSTCRQAYTCMLDYKMIKRVRHTTENIVDADSSYKLFSVMEKTIARQALTWLLKISQTELAS